MIATCPNCGLQFLSGRQRGEGSADGAWMSRVSPTSRLVLETLAGEEEAAVLRLAYRLRQRGHDISTHKIGMRLSKLAGRGLVFVRNTETKIYDEATREWRDETKPVWRLTPEGREYLATGKLPQPPPPANLAEVVVG